MWAGAMFPLPFIEGHCALAALHVPFEIPDMFFFTEDN